MGNENSSPRQNRNIDESEQLSLNNYSSDSDRHSNSASDSASDSGSASNSYSRSYSDSSSDSSDSSLSTEERKRRIRRHKLKVREDFKKNEENKVIDFDTDEDVMEGNTEELKQQYLEKNNQNEPMNTVPENEEAVSEPIMGNNTNEGGSINENNNEEANEEANQEANEEANTNEDERRSRRKSSSDRSKKTVRRNRSKTDRRNRSKKTNRRRKSS